MPELVRAQHQPAAQGGNNFLELQNGTGQTPYIPSQPTRPNLNDDDNDSRGTRLARISSGHLSSSRDSKATGYLETTATMSFGGQTPTIIVLKEG